MISLGRVLCPIIVCSNPNVAILIVSRPVATHTPFPHSLLQTEQPGSVTSTGDCRWTRHHSGLREPLRKEQRHHRLGPKRRHPPTVLRKRLRVTWNSFIKTYDTYTACATVFNSCPRGCMIHSSRRISDIFGNVAKFKLVWVIIYYMKCDITFCGIIQYQK